jgi:hypothetical protein
MARPEQGAGTSSDYSSCRVRRPVAFRVAAVLHAAPVPYVAPNITGWRRSMLRERDITDLCDQEIT